VVHAAEKLSSLPQLGGLLCIAERISKAAKKDGALVSIESAIPKGTSARVFEILITDYMLFMHLIDGTH